MKKVVAFGLLCVVTSAIPGTVGASGGDEPTRHVEKDGKFSYVPPANWTIRQVPGRKYGMAVGPAQSGFAANINVVDENTSVSLDDYAKAAKQQLQTHLKDYKFLEEQEFKTASGLRGIRLIVEDEQQGRRLRQNFFCFARPATKYVVTCTALADGGAKYDKAFEDAMKTFRFEGGDAPTGHVENDEKFSYVPPANWAMQQFPGGKYEIAVGPAQSGFAANINVVDENTSVSLDDYAKAAKQQLQTHLKDYKFLEEQEFKTASGLRGIRLIVEDEQQGRRLRQNLFLFARPQTKYVVTCTTLADGGAKYDKTFEEAMKTFRFKN